MNLDSRSASHHDGGRAWPAGAKQAVRASPPCRFASRCSPPADRPTSMPSSCNPSCSSTCPAWPTRSYGTPPGVAASGTATATARWRRRCRALRRWTIRGRGRSRGLPPPDPRRIVPPPACPPTRPAATAVALPRGSARGGRSRGRAGLPPARAQHRQETGSRDKGSSVKGSSSRGAGRGSRGGRRGRTCRGTQPARCRRGCPRSRRGGRGAGLAWRLWGP